MTDITTRLDESDGAVPTRGDDEAARAAFSWDTAPVVSMSLSADHRVTTGHEGSRLLHRIATLLQTPEELRAP